MNHVRVGTGAFAAAALVTIVASNLDAQVSLKGSPASVERMYSVAVQSGFDFLKNSTAVNAAVSSGKLVRLTGNADYELDSEVQYPYLLSEARLFVERLGEQYRAACKNRLVVTGASRPLDMKLRNGSPLSVHPTGMAVDLRRANLPGKCLSWLKTTLLNLEKAGVIEVTEEKRPSHFHVAVFPASYANYVALQTGTVVATTQPRPAGGPSESPPASTVSYQVRSGDSLWSIAGRYDTTVKALQDLNKMRSDTIYAGQVILVPAPNSN
jgi:LysM repeat protein